MHWRRGEEFDVWVQVVAPLLRKPTAPARDACTVASTVRVAQALGRDNIRETDKHHMPRQPLHATAVRRAQGNALHGMPAPMRHLHGGSVRAPRSG